MKDILGSIAFDVRHVRGRLREISDILLFEDWQAQKSSTARTTVHQHPPRPMTAAESERLASLRNASSEEIQRAIQQKLEASLKL